MKNMYTVIKFMDQKAVDSDRLLIKLKLVQYNDRTG
jgi:hypothetical protein